jgi:radical SAM superfamily enzyme YgiQ (UPF0313 family)
VVDDLTVLAEKYGTNKFFFLEDSFNFSRSYALRLCEAIIRKRLNIQWSSCVYPNSLDEELLSAMKSSGAIRLIYGFETGSPRLQKYINKNLDLERLSTALKIADDLGIWNGIEIIAGLPYETEEDIQASVEFLQHNRQYINEFYIQPFRLASGSHFSRDPEKYSLENLRSYDFSDYYQSLLRYPTKNRLMRYMFDEANGMKWDAKKEQILRSYNRILMAIKYKMIPQYDNLAYLFFFYDESDNKEHVKRMYARYSNILAKKALFRHKRYLFDEILKIRSFTYASNRISVFFKE